MYFTSSKFPYEENVNVLTLVFDLFISKIKIFYNVK